MKTKIYENFPWRIVILANLLPVLVYAVGAYILAGFGLVVAGLYVLYCLVMEFRVFKLGCVNCYYYGKVCGLGKGKLCSLLFKQGDPRKFAETEISWAEMLPDFMVVIFPLLGGIILLIMNFSWLLLAAVIFIGLLYFWGNSLIRGPVMCQHCRQREIGCPAAQLFSKEGTR
ncbi:MAG: hypothetical protein JW953_17375 [Anaerolineae bacterium]|nr:hypothetical protein [Anaerolineae bacterium]